MGEAGSEAEIDFVVAGVACLYEWESNMRSYSGVLSAELQDVSTELEKMKDYCESLVLFMG